jgi:iron(III) transport system substrate-binding protein
MILPEVRDPKNWFGGHLWVDNKTTKRFIYPTQAFFSQTLWYNSDLLKPEEIRSYDDLLVTKWKGKIGMHDPRIAGSGQGLWDYVGMVKGEGYLKRLVEQDLVVSRDLRQLGDMLAKGRLAITLGGGYAPMLPFVQAGLPVKSLPTPKEGTHGSSGFGTVTVMRNPPHPNAARIFINWLLGKQGQEIYGKAMGSGTRRFDVDTKWLSAIGIEAAKDVLTPEEFLARAYFFEDKLSLRHQPQELAKRILK